MASKKISIFQKIKKANEVLKKGEPDNISYDSYTGYSGYSPQYIIDALNEVLGIGNWGFEQLNSKVITLENEPYLVIAKVKVWLKDIEFKPVAYGQSRITRDDVGDAKKGAQTDAIKKALSYFSIGNRAYRGLLEGKVEKKPKTAQAPSTTTKADKAPQEPPKSRWCSVHKAVMVQSISKKTGKPYFSHRSEQGQMCFGGGWQ